jgi:hypothetical protein
VHFLLCFLERETYNLTWNFSSKKKETTTLRYSVLLLLAGTLPLPGSVILNFEGIPDSTILTAQYSGVTFSNAIILTAGVSLNEFEFPPHSGVNVASDNTGPMTLTFASTIVSFGGYFTYAEPLTIEALDGGAEVASATSLFSNNEAISGDPGSSPNEFIAVSFAGGITGVTITGDPLGSSFALDDATYAPAVFVAAGTSAAPHQPTPLHVFLSSFVPSFVYL